MNARIPAILIGAVGLIATASARQAGPLASLKTTAEASEFRQTSTPDGIMSFLKSVAAGAPELVHMTTIGTTTGGRPMPLVVIGAGLPDGTPAAVRSSGKLRVLVQAGTRNEADGTEAATMLVRDLALGRHSEWLQSMVILVDPIVNADANERLALDRDFMGMASSEAKALVKLWTDYDPHASIDLHTTDAVCPAYLVMYAPPHHPITSERILAPLKNDWFPFVSKNLKSKHQMESFYRGRVVDGNDGCNVTVAPAAPAVPPAPRRGGAAPPAAGRGPARAATPGPPAAAVPPADPAWTSIEPAPSLGTNYAGLRNRFGLLAESQAFASLEERVKASGYFLEEALAFLYGAGTRLKKATEDADAELIVGRRLGTGARLMTGAKIEILMGEVEAVPNPAGGAPTRVRKNVVTPVQMTDRLWFEAGTDEITAAEYFVPADLTRVVDLLRAHGVQLRQTTQPTRGLEHFVIATVVTGQSGRILTGDWRLDPSASVPTGTWVVRMNQPLAKLAFLLLEPTSQEGVVTVLDDLKGYPILRRR